MAFMKFDSLDLLSVCDCELEALRRAFEWADRGESAN